MLPNNLSDVSLNDVKTLRDNRVMESRSPDFKAERIGGSDGDKCEFVADVCAFANASGGDLRLGGWRIDVSYLKTTVTRVSYGRTPFSALNAESCSSTQSPQRMSTRTWDYRIAQRMKSTEGWRSFLAAHPAGPHAQSARSELDKLLPVERPHAPAVAQASNGGSSDAKTPSKDSSPDRLSPRSEVGSDEICKRDEDRLLGLSSPTRDEAMRFLTELRCEKLRPELFRLTEHLDYQAPSAAVVAQFPADGLCPRAAGTQAKVEISSLM